MKNSTSHMPSQAGFTLVELLVTMGIFVVIIAVAAGAFSNIVQSAARYTKMEETSIEGAISTPTIRRSGRSFTSRMAI